MRRWLLFFYIFCFSLVGAAQATPRDYAMSPPLVSLSADGSAAIVSFTVSNQGASAAEASEIVITEFENALITIREPLPILAAGAQQAFSIAINFADLPAEELFFKIEAGLDDYELPGSPIARNNTQLFRINKTDIAGDDTATIEPAPAYDIFIPLINWGLKMEADGLRVNGRLYSSGDIILNLSLLALALFSLWLLRLILLLLFRRPPKFEAWQPPYAVNSWYDPDSARGRRQSWQFHAQNSNITAPPTPEQVTVIKRLLDTEGIVLGGWQITALRSMQYDIYGRINRSEALMPRKIIKQLNKVARGAPKMAEGGLRKKIAPIAKQMSKYAMGAIEKQNMMLPIALDMRFEGSSDSARILFELHQYRNEAWHLIDQWEPELGQVGAQLPEHFTFTLNGQYPGESRREFRGRLREDIAELLFGLCYQPPKSKVPEEARASESGSPSEERGSPSEERDSAGSEETPSLASLLGPDDETDVS